MRHTASLDTLSLSLSLFLSLPLSLFSPSHLGLTDPPPELWVWSEKKCRAVVICADTGCVSSSSRHKGEHYHTNRRHCLLFAAHSSVCVSLCVRVCACARVDLTVCASVGRKYFSQPPPRIVSGADILHDIKPVIHPDSRPASERKRRDALVFLLLPLLLPPSLSPNFKSPVNLNKCHLKCPLRMVTSSPFSALCAFVFVQRSQAAPDARGHM